MRREAVFPSRPVSRRAITALSVVVALAAAGCGSTSSSSSKSTAASATATLAANAPKPSGTPLVIWDIGDHSAAGQSTSGELINGEQAAVAYVNAKLGGISGHPLQLKICNSNSDPAQMKVCAGEAVANHALAVTGYDPTFGAAGSAAILQAKIPAMVVPTDPVTFNDPGAFPVGGGAISEYEAQAYYFGSVDKPKKVGLLLPDVPVGREYNQILSAGYTANGAKVTTVYWPVTGADITPSLTQLVEAKPDLISAVTGSGPFGIQAYTGLSQQGFPTKHIVAQGSNVDDGLFFSKLGALANGTRYTSTFLSYDDPDPAVKLYRTAMAADGKNAKSSWAQWGFATVMVLENFAKQMHAPISGPTVFDAMSKAPVIPGFMSHDQAAPLKDYKGIRNPYVRIVDYNSGKLNDLAGSWYAAPPLLNK